MESVFITLSEWVEGGNYSLALLAALLWGVLSIVLSPCHLASIPLIVGFIGDSGRASPVRAFLMSLLFALGILVSIAVIGVATGLMGRMLGDVGRWADYFFVALLILAGLYLIGLVPAPWQAPSDIKVKKRGLFPAFLVGLLFGIALGPCTFAFMAPILGLTFGLAESNLAYGVFLLFAYGIGHCALIVLAGSFSGAVQRYLNWNEGSEGIVWLKRVCGVLVLAGAGYMLWLTLQFASQS